MRIHIPVLDQSLSMQHSQRIFKVGLPEYENFPIKKGLRSLGGEAFLFRDNSGAFKTFAMNYQGKWYRPNEAGSNEIEKVIMATISTDLTIVQHLLNTHLLVAGTFAGVVSQMPKDHPIRRFLHPYTLDTNRINNYNAPLLLYKNALFERLYSFDRETILDIMRKKAAAFDFKTSNPYENLRERGLLNFARATNEDETKTKGFEWPQREIWDVMLNHVRQYVGKIYASEDDFLADLDIEKMHEELKRVFVSSDRNIPEELTRDNFAEMICKFMFQASVEHDLVGVMNLHFLAWMNHIPPRVHLDGSPLPLSAAKISANLLVATQPTRKISVLDDSFDGLIPEKGQSIVVSMRQGLQEIHQAIDREHPKPEGYSVTNPGKHLHQVGS
ncbi:hypothetical protein OAN22_01595 [Alphaproteobacteria bacterium]|nr:hypothetical protein [Alphaproteobacteria bacterium]